MALHMGRGFLMFQGRLTAGLHCMVHTTHGVKQWQCTHTLLLMSHKCTMTGYIIVSEVYITITFDSLSMSIDASLDNIHAPC